MCCYTYNFKFWCYYIQFGESSVIILDDRRGVAPYCFVLMIDDGLLLFFFFYFLRRLYVLALSAFVHTRRFVNNITNFSQWRTTFIFFYLKEFKKSWNLVCGRLMGLIQTVGSISRCHDNVAVGNITKRFARIFFLGKQWRTWI